MMSDVAWAVAMLVLVIVMAILIGGVMGFLRWLVSRFVTGLHWGLRALIWAIAQGSRWVTQALQRATASLAKRSVKLCAAAMQGVAKAARSELFRMLDSIREGWQERTSPLDDQDGETARPVKAASSCYDEAVELMGLTGVEPLTNALLKQRYSELIRIVHPQNGFPSNIFAEQINAAIITIKKAHRWK